MRLPGPHIRGRCVMCDNYNDSEYRDRTSAVILAERPRWNGQPCRVRGQNAGEERRRRREMAADPQLRPERSAKNRKIR
jgi:hypothetical protein